MPTDLLEVGWYFDQPGQQAAVLDQRLPLRQVPAHVLKPVGIDARPAEQHDDRLCLGGDEP